MNQTDPIIQLWERDVILDHATVSDIRNVFENLRTYLNNTIITTIPYDLKEGMNFHLLEMGINDIISSISLKMSQVEILHYEEENQNHSLINRKTKLDKFLLSELIERMDRLEKENEEIRNKLNKKE